ncbi:MAG: hypothetical protein V4437_00385 [Patescibacteria group bacterium]
MEQITNQEQMDLAGAIDSVRRAFDGGDPDAVSRAFAKLPAAFQSMLHQWLPGLIQGWTTPVK